MNDMSLPSVNTANLPKCLIEGSRRAGWIYCIRCDVANAVKIGFSKNPERRIAQLQTANPNPLRFIGMMQSVEAFETFMHLIHRDRRLSGEWFEDLDQTVSDAFKMMVTEDFA